MSNHSEKVYDLESLDGSQDTKINYYKRSSSLIPPPPPRIRPVQGRTAFAPLTRSPLRTVDALVKLPVEFRTLSIQVTDTKRGTIHDYSKGKKDVADLTTLNYHTQTIQELSTSLSVHPELGLDPSIVSRRLIKYGSNKISKPKSNLPKKIFFYFFGGFGTILIFASIICFVAWKPLGNPNPQASNLALAVVLLVVVAVQALFNAYQDYSTGRVMSSISNMLPSSVLVVRDGETFEILATELVKGDLILITLGSKLPADVRLIQTSSDLIFDLSILTGESIPVHGTTDSTDINFMESLNIGLCGTLCTEGSAKAIVVGTGDNTIFGRIVAHSNKERPVKTTLEVEVSRFVKIIAALATFTAALIAIVWAAWLRTSYPGFLTVSGLLINCVSVFVAFIPEGLPISLTVSLSVIAASMKRKNILVKSLSTVESLGCVSVICSDKTGTLTQNKMAVVNIAIGTDLFSASIAKELSAYTSEETNNNTTSNSIKVLASIASICNDASFEKIGSDEVKIEKRKINGDATDTGLLRFAESISSTDVSRESWTEIGKLAFNSKNKFALKLLKCSHSKASLYPINSADDFDYQNDCLLLVKGAPDILLKRCTQYLLTNGTYSILDEEAMEAIEAIQTNLASQGQRVLLLAKKIIKGESIQKETFLDPTLLQESLIGMNVDLIVVGLVALVDPLREDTAETVRICRRAGIRFMMVTGDFALTATAIAIESGIITNRPSAVHHLSDLPRDTPLDKIPEFDQNKAEDSILTSLVLSGSEIMEMTESQWKHTLTYDEVVFARTSPQQKLQIVKAYQSIGDCTVAVTGDGVNDAAALKQADIGVAIGSGSEVALEAADLILLDDFSAMVEGIRSGRLCFENLKKVILYLLPAGSFSELMPVLVNIFFGLPQVLSNIQMIIICTITDVLPALSLVLEQPEADLLLRKPRNRKTDRLADTKLLLHAYGFIGIIESLTSMTSAFYFGFSRAGIPFSSMWLKFGNYDVDPDVFAAALVNAQSIYFFNLVIMQWFNLLSTRTRRLSLFQQNPLGSERTRNYFIFPAMLMALGFAVFFSYIPLFQNIFCTSGIAVEYYFLPMGYGIVVLFIDESRKWWNRRNPTSTLSKIAW